MRHLRPSVVERKESLELSVDLRSIGEVQLGEDRQRLRPRYEAQGIGAGDPEKVLLVAEHLRTERGAKVDVFGFEEHALTAVPGKRHVPELAKRS